MIQFQMRTRTRRFVPRYHLLEIGFFVVIITAMSLAG